MPNNYDKYKLNRRVRGKLNLPDPIQETVVHLVAEGNSFDDIILIMSRQTPPVPLDPTAIQTILDDPLAQRRLEYKKRVILTHKKIPQTADECLEFAKRSLIRLSKLADKDNTKVNALKALAAVAIDERKNAPKDLVVPNQTDAGILDLLNKKESE